MTPPDPGNLTTESPAPDRGAEDAQSPEPLHPDTPPPARPSGSSGGRERSSRRSRSGSRSSGSRSSGSRKDRHDGPQAPPQPHASHGHHGSHGSDSARKLRRMRLLAGMLVALLIVGGVFGVFGIAQLQRFRNEANTLTSKVRQLDAELTRARDRLADMKTDMRVLLANRIPGIAQIAFGRALEINDRYLRSLTFVRSGNEPDQRIEYNLVLENTGPAAVVPGVRILVFDEAGLQTGVATLGAGASEALAPGESRSYHGPVNLERSQVPSTYFLVEVD